MTDGEQVLSLGGVTHVVRIGRTVRRPVRPFTAGVQAYLAHVRSRGFLATPEPLGYDEQGREILSFVEGDVPLDPLPDYATGDQVLADLAVLIRGLHRAAADFVAPPGAVWGAIPGVVPSGVVRLFTHPELVSHQDYCPGNVVFRQGRPAAFIDFDLARPTTRVADLVNALFWWAPLVDPVDRPASLTDVDVPARVRVFADAYGMSREMRSQIVPIAARRTRNSTLTMEAAAAVDPVFRRWWDEGVKDRMPRAELWLDSQADRIAARLLA
jgi:hypothetical protein